jgi:hypothetical protein
MVDVLMRRPQVAGLVILVIALLTTVGCGGGASLERQADWGGLFPPVTVTVLHVSDWTVSLTGTQQLSEVTLYFDNGDSETYPLSGMLGVVHSDNDGGLTYLRASTKGGDYWYFDNAGLWLPHGYRPKVDSNIGARSASSVWVGSQELAITCNDTYTQVKVYYNDDTTQVFDTGATSAGTYDLVIDGANVAAIRIRLSSDDRLYYFAPDGSRLPMGTKWYEDTD